MVLRLDCFLLGDEEVLCNAPGPTEAGRFSSCPNSACKARGNGSTGDLIVGKARIALPWDLLRKCNEIQVPFPTLLVEGGHIGP